MIMSEHYPSNDFTDEALRENILSRSVFELSEENKGNPQLNKVMRELHRQGLYTIKDVYILGHEGLNSLNKISQRSIDTLTKYLQGNKLPPLELRPDMQYVVSLSGGDLMNVPVRVLELGIEFKGQYYAGYPIPSVGAILDMSDEDLIELFHYSQKTIRDNQGPHTEEVGIRYTPALHSIDLENLRTAAWKYKAKFEEEKARTAHS